MFHLIFLYNVKCNLEATHLVKIQYNIFLQILKTNKSKSGENINVKLFGATQIFVNVYYMKPLK